MGKPVHPFFSFLFINLIPVKNVYRTNGLGALSFCRLFLVLLFGAFVWGSSLSAGTASVTGSYGGASGSATGTIGAPYLSGSTFSASYSYDLSVTGYTTSLVLVGYISSTGTRVDIVAWDCNGNTPGRAKSGSAVLSSVPANAQSVFLRAYVQTSASGGVEQFTYESLPLLTQTVTLSPNGGAAAITNGQTFSGTATGAQAGNPYNISIISGQGSAAINSSTGAYTITANGAGLITYKVWISAGSGYERSADAQASIAVAASKQVRITIPANNGAFPIEYRLIDTVTGAQVGTTFVQGAGAGAYIVTVDVPTGNNVTLQSRVVGAAQDDHGNWYVNDEAVTDLPSSAPIAPQAPSVDPSTPNSPTPAPQQATPGTPAAAKAGTKIVWSSGSGSMDPTQQVDLLTNSTFKEGVQNVVDGMMATSEAFWSMMDEKSEDGQSVIQQMENQSQSVMEEARDAAMAHAADMSAVFSGLANTSTVNVPSANSTPLSYGVAGTSFQLSLNPFSAVNQSRLPAWLFQLIDLTRIIIGLTALGMLYMDIMRKSREAILGVLQVNREGEFAVERKIAGAAASIPLAGGFIGGLAGMAFRVGIFAVFAATIISLPTQVALVLDVFTSLGFDSYRDALADVMNSGGSMAVILGMAVKVVPIAVLVTVFFNRMLAETLLNGAVLPVAVYIKLFRM